MTDMASNHGKIARVFPRRTAATPEDPYAFTGPPPCGELPDISEVHISVTFTYDMQKAERLADMWSAQGFRYEWAVRPFVSQAVRSSPAAISNTDM